MDLEKIRNIKKNSDMIRKFRSLDKYKNMSENEFKCEMEKILPNFCKSHNHFFEIIIANKDLYFLDLMFHKIDEIDKNVPSGNFLFFSYPFMKYNSNQYIIPMHADKKIVINTLIGPNHKPRIHIN